MENTNEAWDEKNVNNLLVARAKVRKNKNRVMILNICKGLQAYLESRVNKYPCRTSSLTGWAWVVELLNGNPTRIQQECRMNGDVFLKLCDELVNKYGLCPPQNDKGIRVEESVAIFLNILAGGTKVRNAEERFQHSGETIHRHFNCVLKAVQRLAVDYCKPVRDQNEVHPYIWNNQKYRVFKDCIGAIDGTHVHAKPKPAEAYPYFSRKGCYTQNIMAACDFDLCFTFVSCGWEGSMHDARVFNNVTNDPRKKFPKPYEGKYYLVDAGYANRKGYLAPYKGDDTRYHQQEFNLGLPPQNANERFNQLHSSLRSVIERTFGVWKSRWGILRDMPTYSMEKQVAVVGGSMGLHNFIRKHNEVNDPFYDEVMRNEQEVGEEFNDENDSDSMENNTELGDDVWIAFRNELRNRISLRNR